MNDSPCPLCEGEIWKTVDSKWKRCIRCGYLETTSSPRLCQNCGKEIGRYAKKTMVYCLACAKGQAKKPRAICSTPGCGNTVGKKQLKTGLCRQCNREKNDWLTPNGHLWKQRALFILNEMQPIGELHRIIKQSYPELSRESLKYWLARQMKLETVERVKHGLYQTVGQAAPEPSEQPRNIIVAGQPGSGVTIHRIPDD